MIFQRILDKLNEDFRNTYHSTDKVDDINKKIGNEKNVSVINPSSTRTITKGLQNTQTEIGDVTSGYNNKTTYKRPSTAIEKVDYNPKEEIATVTFKNGNKGYDYKVNPDEMKEFLDAPSKGQWVNNIWKYNNRID